MRPLIFTLYLCTQFTWCLTSQTLMEEIGGVRTNFTIVSDTLWLDTDEQFLIKRATKEINLEEFDDGTLQRSEAYESYHLEFILPGKIQTIRKIGKSREYYFLEFFTDGDQLILSVELQPKEIKSTTNWKDTELVAYSINLQQVPLVILDRTLKLNFVKYTYQRYR